MQMHNTVGSVLCRYLSLLCCTILQAAYYVDILVITLLHNIVGSVLCRYLGHYFAAQYCRQRTMQISWSLLCCTILQAAVLCRYFGHYFAAQYYQAAYYVDILVINFLHNIVGSVYVYILVITLLHNTVGSVLYRYIGRYFAQYCRQRNMQISWSLTILQAGYYVGYFCPDFAAQFCRQRTMKISQSLFCCTIMQEAYNVDILVITLLHNIVGSVLCKYLCEYFAVQYFQAVYNVDILSLLCCTILQTV